MIALFSDPLILGLVLLGTTLGITVGGIPGLTGTMLIALTLPFTFSMQPVEGLVPVSYTHLTLPTILRV